MASRPQSYVNEDPTGMSLTSGQPDANSPLAAGQDAHKDMLNRSASMTSTKVSDAGGMSRGGTLKKRGSMKKRSSVRRSSSKRSLKAGSIKGLGEVEDDNFNSIFYTPIPTSGSPTDILANRFEAWRKLLKDLMTYFREVQSSYQTRSKSLIKVSNVINNTSAPSLFLASGGLDDALHVLRGFHKHAIAEANKAGEIESDVITQLGGLRDDLRQKIKEIKSLSGDFKNSVEKEKDVTRRSITAYQDALEMAERDPSSAAGKGDPFLMRLAVDRQIEKQVEEENYLHRAYLNLEGSGRELESIVVGEIQKAYNALAGILKREADSGQDTLESLRAGPVAMPKDHEWSEFVENDEHFVSPTLPLRKLGDIQYPGKYNPGGAEIRAGMLERKSKYLKSYTAGWYVLSPTHLHEFKSADHIHTQQPVMSLFLLDQKLGSKSAQDSSSHKFSLKGRQTGAMHRGHSWVFRAESYDTMLAWYEDIRTLTEKTGAEKTAFLQRHARSTSGGSHPAPSVSSDGLEEDEADSVPYSAHEPAEPQQEDAYAGLDKAATPKRPEGGRFPSDINVNRNRNSQPAPSASSASSTDAVFRQRDNEIGSLVMAGAIPAGAIQSSEDAEQGAHEHDKVVGTQPGLHEYSVVHEMPAQASPPKDSRFTEQLPDSLNEELQTNQDSERIPVGMIIAGPLRQDTNQSPTQDDTEPKPRGLINTDAPRQSTALSSHPPASSPKVQVDPAQSNIPVGMTYIGDENKPKNEVATSPSIDSLDSPLPAGARLDSNTHSSPTFLRHNTNISLSDVHVPGEFPAQRMSSNT